MSASGIQFCLEVLKSSGLKIIEHEIQDKCFVDPKCLEAIVEKYNNHRLLTAGVVFGVPMDIKNTHPGSPGGEKFPSHGGECRKPILRPMHAFQRKNIFGKKLFLDYKKLC